MKFTLFLILTLVSLFPLSSFSSEPSLLIEKPGSYAISPAESVEITEKDSKLTVLRPASKGGVVFDVEKGWKFYTDKENVLWFYDGVFELVRMEFSDKNIAFQQASASKELWDEAPKAFTALIPKNRLRPLPRM